MKTFHYRARDTFGVALQGAMESESAQELGRHLGRFDLTLEHAREARSSAATRSLPLSQRMLPQLLRDLATVDDSGIPLLEGLDDIRSSDPRSATARIAEALAVGVNQGRPVSDVMTDHPRAFPREVVATAAAGEQSGSLSSVLVRLADHLEWKQTIRSQARQTMVYPSLLALAILGLVVLMLTFLIPRISGLFTKLKVELPLPTRIVISASDLLLTLWPTILGTLVFAGFALWLTLRTRRGLEGLHRFVLDLPIVGPIMRRICAAQLCSSLSTLIASGLALPKALEITAEAMSNRWVGARVRDAQQKVVGGTSLADSLDTASVLPPLVRRMVVLGEATGNLEQSLGRVVQVFDREVPLEVNRLVRMIEPATILIGGGVVAFMVISALMPIFQLVRSLR